MCKKYSIIYKEWVSCKRDELKSIIFRNREESPSLELKEKAKRLWVGFYMFNLNCNNDISNLASFHREFDLYKNYISEILLDEPDYYPFIDTNNSEYNKYLKIVEEEIENINYIKILNGNKVNKDYTIEKFPSNEVLPFNNEYSEDIPEKELYKYRIREFQET